MEQLKCRCKPLKCRYNPLEDKVVILISKKRCLIVDNCVLIKK